MIKSINIDNNNCQESCDIDFYRLIDKIGNVYRFIEQFSDIDFIDCPGQAF